jgi:hypothetical protein
MKEFSKPQYKIQVPIPTFPVSEAGQYANDVKRIGELLKNGELAEFYGEAGRVLQKIYDDEGIRLRRNRKPGGNDYSKEELVGLEWLYYYLASSPLEKNDGSEWSNLEIKFTVARRFSNENPIKTADFLSVDRKLFQETHCAYLIAILRTVNNSIAIAKENCKKIKQRSNDFRNRLLLHKIAPEKIHETSKLLEKNHRSTFVTLSFFEPTAVMGARNMEIHEEGFVKTIIKAFPKNGGKVRDSLRKSGFGSDFEIACLLQRYVGRDKENAYLYSGLPSQKDVDKAFNEEKKKIEMEKTKKDALRRQEIEKRFPATATKTSE